MSILDLFSERRLIKMNKGLMNEIRSLCPDDISIEGITVTVKQYSPYVAVAGFWVVTTGIRKRVWLEVTEADLMEPMRRCRAISDAFSAIKQVSPGGYYGMTNTAPARHMTASERFAALHPHLQKCAEHISEWNTNYDYCAWVEVERRAAFTHSPSGFTKDGWYEARELYLAMQQEQASDELEQGNSKPSWNDAPEWAEWLAQDESGAWYWSENKPVQGISHWLHRKGRFEFVCGTIQRNQNWRETLERRPAMSKPEPSEWPETRVDVIGQNGNDGLHYGTGEVGVPGVLAGPDQHIAGSSALRIQVGGSHYKDMTIQPVEYIHANNLGFCEGAVVKYVSRWRSKNGIKDLEKARHFIDLLIELETKQEGE